MRVFSCRAARSILSSPSVCFSSCKAFSFCKSSFRADVEVACISPWLTSTVCTQFTGYGFVRRSLKHIRLIGSCFFSFFVPGERQKSTRISDPHVHLCQHLGAKLSHLRTGAPVLALLVKQLIHYGNKRKNKTKPHSRTPQASTQSTNGRKHNPHPTRSAGRFKATPTKSSPRPPRRQLAAPATNPHASRTSSQKRRNKPQGTQKPQRHKWLLPLVLTFRAIPRDDSHGMPVDPNTA